MAARDQNGWTWGGVLQGVAKVAGYIAVGCAVYMGVAAAAGLAFGFQGGSMAASMLGASGTGLVSSTGATLTGLSAIAAIPGQFATMVGSLPVISGAVSMAGDAVNAVSGAVGATKDAVVGTAQTVASKASEYAVPAATAAVGAAVGGAYMYGKGKEEGVKKAVGKFTQAELERRAQASVAQGHSAG